MEVIMTNNIKKKAKKFAKHKVHWTVDCNAILSHLTSINYTVVYYNLSEPNELITGYKLTELSKRVSAFAVHHETEKFVFLRSDITEEKKLYALLHEAAHITLGHMDEDHIPKHKRLEEMEAEAFAYEVLQCKPHNNIVWVLSSLILAVSLGIGSISYFNSPTEIPYNSVITETVSKTVNNFEDSEVLQKVYNEVMESSKAEKVYITPSGKKYHLPSCRYVKNKNCTALERADAEKKYEPCSVCKP